MKIKPITFLTLLLGGIALCFTFPFSSTAENDPWAKYFGCYDQCISEDVEEECEEVCNSEGWQTFLDMRLPVVWQAEGRIPVLRGSSGSHVEPDEIMWFPYPLLKLPNDKPVEILTGVALTPKLKPYTVNGELKNVTVSISFLNAKGKVIAKTGKQPMKSAAFGIKKLEVTQKFGKRVNFNRIKEGEMAYFIAQPNFGGFEVQGVQEGMMLVKVSSVDKFGKTNVISTSKMRARYADEESYKKLTHRK